jgi:CRP-like cAMP-binding protein
MLEPSQAHMAGQNRLLAALPNDESKRLQLHLEAVTLQLGEILFRPEDALRYVYFPTTAIISLLTDLSEGTGIEVGLVGREGMADVSVILNAGSESKVATVQGVGTAMRMKASVLKEEFERGGKLQDYLLRYTNALMSQISHSAVCNLRHKIDCRLARWLLMYQDRTQSDEFFLTQDFIANMLGLRRAGVSTVAHRLRQAGLIQYKRGNIKILDRQGLKEMTCECYPVLKAEFDRLYDY